MHSLTQEPTSLVWSKRWWHAVTSSLPTPCLYAAQLALKDAQSRMIVQDLASSKVSKAFDDCSSFAALEEVCSKGMLSSSYSWSPWEPTIWSLVHLLMSGAVQCICRDHRKHKILVWHSCAGHWWWILLPLSKNRDVTRRAPDQVLGLLHIVACLQSNNLISQASELPTLTGPVLLRRCRVNEAQLTFTFHSMRSMLPCLKQFSLELQCKDALNLCEHHSEHHNICLTYAVGIDGQRLHLSKGVVGPCGRWAELEPSRHMIGLRGLAIEPMLWMKFWTLGEAKAFLAGANEPVPDAYDPQVTLHASINASEDSLRVEPVPESYDPEVTLHASIDALEDFWNRDPHSKIDMAHWHTWLFLIELANGPGSVRTPQVMYDRLTRWSFCSWVSLWVYYIVQGLLYTLSPDHEDLASYRDLDIKVMQTAPEFGGLPDDSDEELPDILPCRESHHHRNKWALPPPKWNIIFGLPKFESGACMRVPLTQLKFISTWVRMQDIWHVKTSPLSRYSLSRHMFDWISGIALKLIWRLSAYRLVRCLVSKQSLQRYHRIFFPQCLC